jgi:fatty acid/phospholipid biosynthesis enzyme
LRVFHGEMPILAFRVGQFAYVTDVSYIPPETFLASPRAGTALLGVNGVCIIGHGRSDRYAVRQAIAVAAQAVANRLVPTLRHALELLHRDKEG